MKTRDLLAINRISTELFFIFLFFRFGAILSSFDTLVFYDCSHDDNVSNFTYHYSDLNNLFSYLNSNAKSSYGFANTSVNDAATAKLIYGLIMCYKDAIIDDCSACLDFSTTNGTIFCPVSSSAVFFYESCFLRYGDQDFISTLALDQKPQCTHSISSVSDSISMQNTISSLLEAQRLNLDSHYLYAYDNKTDPGMKYSIYALVQCTRDLSLVDCDLCLQYAIGNLSACSSNYKSVSASIQLMSCYVSYEVYALNMANRQLLASPSPPLSPPPPPPTDWWTTDSESSGPKSKLTVASCIVAAVFFIFIGCTVYCCCKKSRRRNSAEPMGRIVEVSRVTYIQR